MVAASSPGLMANPVYLGGKVVKSTVPEVRGAPGPDAPVLKRLLLPQGELAQFYDAAEGIRYMAIIELKPGKPRGNHYHKVKEEMVYLFEGKAELIVEDVDGQGHASVPLETGDLVMIQTEVAHALRASEPGKAIEFSKTRFNARDIYPYKLCD